MNKLLERMEAFYSHQNFAVIMAIRITLFLLLVLLLFVIGLMIGYSVLGDGGSPFAIFSGEVWQKIFEFVGSNIHAKF